MAVRAKRPTTKAGKSRKVHRVMSEYEAGTLRSSSGAKVRSRKQAIAIAMSESGQARPGFRRKK